MSVKIDKSTWNFIPSDETPNFIVNKIIYIDLLHRAYSHKQIAKADKYILTKIDQSCYICNRTAKWTFSNQPCVEELADSDKTERRKEREKWLRRTKLKRKLNTPEELKRLAKELEAEREKLVSLVTNLKAEFASKLDNQETVQDPVITEWKKGNHYSEEIENQMIKSAEQVAELNQLDYTGALKRPEFDEIEANVANIKNRINDEKLPDFDKKFKEVSAEIKSYKDTWEQILSDQINRMGGVLAVVEKFVKELYGLLTKEVGDIWDDLVRLAGSVWVDVSGVNYPQPRLDQLADRKGYLKMQKSVHTEIIKLFRKVRTAIILYTHIPDTSLVLSVPNSTTLAFPSKIFPLTNIAKENTDEWIFNDLLIKELLLYKKYLTDTETAT